MSTVAKKRYTVEEYLAIDRDSDSKFEFIDGRICAMAGTSEPHNLIVRNLVRELGSRLKERNGRVYASDMRVVCPTGRRTYPDVAVVCGSPQFEDNRNDTLLNPFAIVEVLSPAPEADERGGKFTSYRTIPSLRTCVFVDEGMPLVDCYERESGQWVLRYSTDLESEHLVRSLDVRLPLPEIYRDVEFSKRSARLRPTPDS